MDLIDRESGGDGSVIGKGQDTRRGAAAADVKDHFRIGCNGLDWFGLADEIVSSTKDFFCESCCWNTFEQFG